MTTVTVTLGDIAGQLAAADTTPFNAAAADQLLDDLEPVMCELYQLNEAAGTLAEYHDVNRAWGELRTRISEEHPWTLFTRCTGSDQVWIPAGSAQAVAIFAAAMRADPFAMCGQCGDTVWSEYGERVLTPPVTASTDKVTILDPAGNVVR